MYIGMSLFLPKRVSFHELDGVDFKIAHFMGYSFVYDFLD